MRRALEWAGQVQDLFMSEIKDLIDACDVCATLTAADMVLVRYSGGSCAWTCGEGRVVGVRKCV